jgi:prophage regulatory protein
VLSKAPTDAKIKMSTTGTRLLSKPEVLDRTGVTYPTIWQWMRDGRFPRSRTLGGKICWIESEVEQWMKDLPRTKLKAPDKVA